MTKFLMLAFSIFISLNLNAQRNVILIIADDLGTDYLGFYEGFLDTANMPNVRQMAAQGLQFKQAMSNPVCSPTRAGILTGRFSFRTGVGNFIGTNNGEPTLDTAEITIPRLINSMQANSVKTAVFGKWHLHRPTPSSNLSLPKLLGFNTCVGGFEGSINNYYNWTKYTDTVATVCTTYATTETVNNALQWLKQQGDTSFFLWMSFNAPHTPYHNPPANLHTVPGCTGAKADITENPKKYFKATLEALDTEIGRMMDSLALWNKLDSTYIIFTSDNGNFKKVAQNPDVNKAKSTVYEAGIHVPLIVVGPGVIQTSRKSNALVNTQDLFATIVEMFGFNNWQSFIPQSTDIDSRSLMPIISNLTDSVRPWAFTEIFRVTPDTMNGKTIRNKKYKLLRFDDGRTEFYNLESDSNEQNNLLLAALTSDAQQNFDWLCNQYTQLFNGCASVCEAPLSVTTSAQPVFCNGNSTGVATAQVYGGKTPYTYIWNNGCTTSVNTNLTASTYTVTVTDFCGNSISKTTEVVQPNQLHINFNNTYSTCGKSDGTLIAEVSNGISPYSYLWSNGNTTDSLQNISDATYTITVTDAFGCPMISAHTLGCIPPKPLHINGPLEICPHQQNVVYSTDSIIGANIYTWSKPGKAEIISGQGTTSIVVNFGNQGGHVQVKAGNSNGYSLNKKQLISLATNCRTYSNSFDDINIFPQPSNTDLHISGIESIKKFELTNQMGQIIFKQNNAFSDSEILLDVSTYAEGIYFLKLFDHKTNMVYKVIIN
jgi:arylsulfatase B